MTNNELILKEMQFQYLTSPGLQMTASLDSLGVSWLENNGFYAGALAANNKIYFTPRSNGTTANRILVIDCMTQTGELLTPPNTWSNTLGGVLTYGGAVVAVPGTATSSYSCDHFTGNINASASVYEPGTLKWWGGITGKNGKTIFIPHNATDVAIVDTYNASAGTTATQTRTRTAFGLSLIGTAKWASAAMGLDDWAYCAPYDATDILMIEMANRNLQIAKKSAFGLDLSGSGKFVGAVTGGDGKIYCVPHNAPYVLVIDPTTQTAEKKTFGLDLTDLAKWHLGCVGPDGKIYCCPYDARDFLIIDPFKQTAIRTTMGLTLPAGKKWSGGTQAPDGTIYFCPWTGWTDVIVIRPKWPGGHERALLASPYFNHS